jgi:hypothetical protein
MRNFPREHATNMRTNTVALVAVMIAATAALALAPTFISSAEATHREGHEGNPKTTTTTTCIHNGNLNECKQSPPPGKSGQEFTTTCTGHGSHIECTQSP